MNPDIDVIDAAAGLQPGTPLHATRRQRGTAIAGTQASHDALLFEPVPGLSPADRLRVALQVCEAAGAPQLAAHYVALLADPARRFEAASPALPAMQAWARLLTTDPRRGDRAALRELQASGLDDAAIVALAQLVAFLSYQTRLVAGLRALQAPPATAAGGGATSATAAPTSSAPDASAPAAPASAGPSPASSDASRMRAAEPPPIRRNGFTNQTLQWRSWLTPLAAEQATPLQQQVLDESHPQARSSAYYLTLIHQPLMLRHRSAAYNAIMYAPGGLPRAERELGALIVSVTNGCVYCTSVHAQRYAQLARRHDTVEQAFDDPASAGSTDRERAIARFAQAVTLRPHELGAGDVEPLRAQGLSDADVIDLLHAVAIFGWANRLMHNLGEPELPADA